MLFGEGAGRPRPAAHRAGPRHALAPRPGVVPRRLDRPRGRLAGGHRAARGRGGDRPRPGRRPGLRDAARSCGCRRATSRSPRCWAGGARRARSASSTPREVHAVYRVPIEELLDPEHRVSVRHPSGWTGPAFLIGDDKDLMLWGFTAGIIARLFDFLGWTRPWDVDGPARPARPYADRSARGRTPSRRSRTRTSASGEVHDVNVLDWFLVVLVLAYAVSGYWQGFIAGAFATGGLLLGGLLGIWLAPRLLGDAEPGPLGVARRAVRGAGLRVVRAGRPAVRRRQDPRRGSRGSRSVPSTRSAERR